MSTASVVAALPDDAHRALVEGRHGDPFSLLGRHPVGSGAGAVLRTFQPGARAVTALLDDGAAVALTSPGDDGLFVGEIPLSGGYRLRVEWPESTQETADPYAFGTLLGDLDLYLIAEGRHHHLADALGANPMTIDGVEGTRFAVWAPNASRVAVIGDFNSWDGRRHPMRLRREAGVWELFVPGVGPGARYKYQLLDGHGRRLPDKADPVARMSEMPPATASIVADATPFEWHDEDWMAARARRQSVDAPMSIYEVHAGSWFHGDDGKPLDWDALADRLVPYVVGMGFTHVELMPVTEHPFYGSWGYQSLGAFAPSARYGSPAAFARFVDRCHRDGIGVILDWVPAHFPTDGHGLARFDGTALYEHADPREGFHRDWHTFIYNHGRREVSGFLLASALEWLRRFHIDGLRVDAVASMLYRDYSRNHGEWIPNVHGGRENYETIAFLRQLNQLVASEAPGAITIAEESTAWPGVTAPVAQGGLGFTYKWNMGWMHDTLAYAQREPIHRRWHHDELTFGLVYAYSEKFVLPLSHDEVVHGKRSLLGRMPGDAWSKLAQLRAYLAFMWTHPGKKLLFMGGELAQPTEWNHDQPLPWHLLDDPAHRGVQRLVRDLNRVYAHFPALHASDADPAGFQWLVGDDRDNSTYAWLRRHGDASPLLAVLNMTPVMRQGYDVGVPQGGRWRPVIDTDAGAYGGADTFNQTLATEARGRHGQAYTLSLTLPPFSLRLYMPDGA